MVGIMTESQQYVPMVEMMKYVYVPSLKRTAKVATAIAHRILFAGWAARARGAQKANVHEVSPSSKVVGLIPVVADWHTKVKLLMLVTVIFCRYSLTNLLPLKQVIWKFFYSTHSQGDQGMLIHLGTS